MNGLYICLKNVVYAKIHFYQINVHILTNHSDIISCWHTLYHFVKKNDVSKIFWVLSIMQNLGYASNKDFWERYDAYLESYDIYMLMTHCESKRVLDRLSSYVPNEIIYNVMNKLLSKSFNSQLWRTKILYKHIVARSAFCEYEWINGLFIACKNGKMQHVKWWFKVDNNKRIVCINHAIKTAASNGHTDIVEYIVANNRASFDTMTTCWIYGKIYGVIEMLGLK